MAATRTAAAVRDRDDAVRAFVADGCSAPRSWSTGPGGTYGTHAHGYHKVLFCLEGSITFHLRDRDVDLSAGDRVDVEPDTEHSATVGPDGCSCIEASR